MNHVELYALEMNYAKVLVWNNKLDQMLEIQILVSRIVNYTQDMMVAVGLLLLQDMFMIISK